MNQFLHAFFGLRGVFLASTASMTSKVKNKYAYVITQDICNKFIEVNFCVGCMVSQPNNLLQRLTTMSLINKIYFNLRKTKKNICTFGYRKNNGLFGCRFQPWTNYNLTHRIWRFRICLQIVKICVSIKPVIKRNTFWLLFKGNLRIDTIICILLKNQV